MSDPDAATTMEDDCDYCGVGPEKKHYPDCIYANDDDPIIVDDYGW
jgi:hypothetical protein